MPYIIANKIIQLFEQDIKKDGLFTTILNAARYQWPGGFLCIGQVYTDDIAARSEVAKLWFGMFYILRFYIDTKLVTQRLGTTEIELSEEYVRFQKELPATLLVEIINLENSRPKLTRDHLDKWSINGFVTDLFAERKVSFDCKGTETGIEKIDKGVVLRINWDFYRGFKGFKERVENYPEEQEMCDITASTRTSMEIPCSETSSALSTNARVSMVEDLEESEFGVSDHGFALC